MSDLQEFQRVADLFERARALSSDDREAILRDSAAHGETRIVERVRRLLAHHDTDNAALQTDAAIAIVQEVQHEKARGLPESIGGYRISRLIGQGGMGLVFLAEQTTPKRSVALKIIRPGLLNDELRRRFEFESTVLGQLQHPGIAQVYDAGVESGDRPYFVMEYIDGLPLKEFAEESNLSVRRRLSLFAQICDAVLHAHQRGIIHRDLKSANILVTKEGQPKILDFGVARAVDADLQATTMATKEGQLVGTLPYMSPEQIQGRALDIGTRSDVYSLGVILYELLAGKLPIDVADSHLASAARAICDDEPTPLTHYNKQFRGDLNTITLKALEKAPDRRYQSASDLAGDVRRYINNEPIEARPATLGYHLTKFAGRHKGLVAGLAATVLMMVAGIIGTTTQAVRATNQKRLAQQEASVAKEVNQFIRQWLLSVDPTLAEGKASEVTMQDALDRAVTKLQEQPPEHARVQASLEDTIGRAYISLGIFDKADQHLVKALDKTREWYGDTSLETAHALGQLGILRRMQGRYEEAENLDSQALELYQNLPEARQNEIATTYGRLVLTYIEAYRFDDALECAQKAIEIRRDIAASDTQEELLDVDAAQSLAAALIKAKRFEEAEPIVVDVNQKLRDIHGESSYDYAYGVNIEGLLYRETGRLDKAIDCFRRVVEINDVIYDEAHPEPAASRVNLAIALQDRDDYDPEAETFIREAADMYLTRLGPDHPHTLFARAALGNLLNSTKRQEEARPILEDVFQKRRMILGDEHPQTFSSLSNLVTYHRWVNEFDVAAELLRPFLELYEEVFGRDDPRTTWALYLYARQIHDAGVVAKSNAEIEESLPLYQEVHDRFKETDHPRGDELKGHWLRALRQLGREEDANELEATFRSAAIQETPASSS